MTRLQLDTPRLRLRAFDPELRRAWRSDRFADVLKATTPTGWSGRQDLLRVWASTPPGLASLEGWGAWLGMVADRFVFIGCFHGPPDRNGAVDIGYELAPCHRGMGLATEAVLALTRHAHRSGAHVVRATVRRDHRASRRVLERCQFHVHQGLMHAEAGQMEYRHHECDPPFPR